MEQRRVTEWVFDFYDGFLEIVDFIVQRTSESLAGILIKALPLLAPVPNAVTGGGYRGHVLCAN
jgi:hypothetical protein